MSNELENAIKSFCIFLPDTKVGTYSPNPNDDRRLKSILEAANKNKEEVRPSDIIEGLKKYKQNNVAEDDILECGDTAFKHMLQL